MEDDTMADQYSFLVIKYPMPETATVALGVLKQLADDQVVKLKDAVALTKTPSGKLELHQTKDDSIGKGFVKGGLLGVILAALFGPAGWIVLGAAAGGVFAGFDRGIKNKLLQELGQGMKSDESAIAILVEEADWPLAFERMRSYGFGGQLVLSEITPKDMDEVEKLLEDPKTVESVPEELDIVTEWQRDHAAPAPAKAVGVASARHQEELEAAAQAKPADQPVKQ
jgi:uncharacterized membrane protein